jgi:hypothetical protein
VAKQKRNNGLKPHNGVADKHHIDVSRTSMHGGTPKDGEGLGNQRAISRSVINAVRSKGKKQLTLRRGKKFGLAFEWYSP